MQCIRIRIGIIINLRSISLAKILLNAVKKASSSKLMMEKTIFCNNKCIHYRRSCQMLSNFFGNHHPRNGRGKGKVKTSVTFCEMQRLMLQTFSAPTFLLPLMFAILRERLYLDCIAVPRDLRKIKYFFSYYVISY